VCLCVDTTNAGQDAMYPCVVVAKHRAGHWHCLHSMQSRVYATVGRPSIRLSHQAATRCCYRFAAVGPAARRYQLIAAWPVVSSSCTVAWRAAANAGSATLLANVGSW